MELIILWILSRRDDYETTEVKIYVRPVLPKLENFFSTGNIMLGLHYFWSLFEKKLLKQS